jgi:hypothetical protein
MARAGCRIQPNAFVTFAVGDFNCGQWVFGIAIAVTKRRLTVAGIKWDRIACAKAAGSRCRSPAGLAAVVDFFLLDEVIVATGVARSHPGHRTVNNPLG